jgi:hypothetical protein
VEVLCDPFFHKKRLIFFHFSTHLPTLGKNFVEPERSIEAKVRERSIMTSESRAAAPSSNVHTDVELGSALDDTAIKGFDVAGT